jgi:hypothetical protein
MAKDCRVLLFGLQRKSHIGHVECQCDARLRFHRRKHFEDVPFCGFNEGESGRAAAKAPWMSSSVHLSAFICARSAVDWRGRPRESLSDWVQGLCVLMNSVRSYELNDPLWQWTLIL